MQIGKLNNLQKPIAPPHQRQDHGEPSIRPPAHDENEGRYGGITGQGSIEMGKPDRMLKCSRIRCPEKIGIFP